MLAVALAVTAALGGCLVDHPVSGEHARWQFGAHGHVETVDGAPTFVGYVALGGSTDAPEAIEDVRLVFEDADHAVRRTVELGDFDASRWEASVNVTLAAPPAYVLVRAGAVRDPDASPPYEIYGLQRADSGDYVRYVGYDAVPDDDG